MKKQTVAVVGASGKMGCAVCKKLQKFYKLIKIDLKNSISEAKNADLVIDFSTGTNSLCTAEFCKSQRIPLIIGATGQTEEEFEKIKSASSEVPVLICRNFSLGIFMVKKFIELVYKIVLPEVTILEKHHSRKKDSPSGTAIDLREHICKFTLNKPEILSERGGKEIGTHSLDFYFGDELLTISHKAFSRDSFADGVLISARFMLAVTLPGMYSFDEILSKKINSV